MKYWAEPGAYLQAVVRGDSALLIVEPDNTSVRIQRPLGPDGFSLLREELPRWRDRTGALLAGLRESEVQSVVAPVGADLKVGPPSRDELAATDLAAFDPALPGRKLKTLRGSVARAERAGYIVRRFDPRRDVESALALYEAWTRHRPRQYVDWIPAFIKESGEVPGLLGLVGEKDGAISAIHLALTSGAYAYQVVGLNDRSTAPVSELVDYRLLCALRETGVTRVDWGVSIAAGVRAYKTRFRPAWESYLTVWLPG